MTGSSELIVTGSPRRIAVAAGLERVQPCTPSRVLLTRHMSRQMPFSRMSWTASASSSSRTPWPIRLGTMRDRTRRPGLVHAGLVGIGGFVLLVAAGAVILHADGPLAGRDAVREMLGLQWRQALVLPTGRICFDFGCLLCALRVTGAHPQPWLALLAYARPPSSPSSP
jgi:hypothetical protein